MTLVILLILGTILSLPPIPRYPSKQLPYFNLVDLAPLHQLGLNGSGVTVAVLDSGLNATSPPFSATKIVAWRDFVGNSSTPYDDLGHGTAVASIIAGKPIDYKFKNGTSEPAFVGIADGVTLAIGKVIDSNNTIKDCNTIGTAIHWAVNAGANIINLSIFCNGVTDGKSPIDQAIDWAAAQGVLVVAITGNFGNKSGSIKQPGDAQGALTVGAVDFTGTKVQPYSGLGPTQDGRRKPDIVAPSGNTNATKGAIVAVSRDGIVYDNWWGTSFSAPIVTGISALLKEWNPHLSGSQIKAALESAATSERVPSPNDIFGHGLVNATRTFIAISGQSPRQIILWRALQNGLTFSVEGALAILLGEGLVFIIRRRRKEHHTRDTQFRA